MHACFPLFRMTSASCDAPAVQHEDGDQNQVYYSARSIAHFCAMYRAHQATAIERHAQRLCGLAFLALRSRLQMWCVLGSIHNKKIQFALAESSMFLYMPPTVIWPPIVKALYSSFALAS